MHEAGQGWPGQNAGRVQRSAWKFARPIALRGNERGSVRVAERGSVRGGVRGSDRRIRSASRRPPAYTLAYMPPAIAEVNSLPDLVSTAWLVKRLSSPTLRVVDGSWYLPASGRDAAAEYANGHIPGAVFFDLDATSDGHSQLPHMLPGSAEFARRMEALGIGSDDEIVVYDGSGNNLTAPRVWWTFRVFGHAAVAVLDGGFGKWLREGRPIERGAARAPANRRFTARAGGALVRDLDAMRANLATGLEQVVDARSADRFAGTEPEPRPSLRAGHIPGSMSLPFTELSAADGTFLRPAELRRRFAAAGVDLDRPVVATCGSGVTACAVAFALRLLDRPDAAVYDGSWTEWGGRADTPIAAAVSVERGVDR